MDKIEDDNSGNRKKPRTMITVNQKELLEADFLSYVNECLPKKKLRCNLLEKPGAPVLPGSIYSYGHYYYIVANKIINFVLDRVSRQFIQPPLL